MIMRERKTKNVALAVAKITTNALTDSVIPEKEEITSQSSRENHAHKSFDMYEDLDEFEGKYGATSYRLSINLFLTCQEQIQPVPVFVSCFFM